MLEEVIETVVEIAADVAEAVITDAVKKKKNASHSCGADAEQE